MDGIAEKLAAAAAGGNNMAGILEEARQLTTAIESRFKRDPAAEPAMLAVVNVVELCAAAGKTAPGEPAPSDPAVDATAPIVNVPAPETVVETVADASDETDTDIDNEAAG